VKIFSSTADYLDLLPKNISESFTNKKLSDMKKIPIRLTQKMTFCLRKMNIIEIEDKKGNAYIYNISKKVVE
jgi:hypothetical protein